MRTSAILLVLVMTALLAAGCATPAPSASSTAATEAATEPTTEPEPEPAEPTETPTAEPTAEATEPQPEQTALPTTEDTIAQIAGLTPEQRAAAHDHGDEHEGHDMSNPAHPNGVDPERIVIPAIGVDADVIDLGLQADGTMEVPSDFAQTGWFEPGPPPGRVGPAVIAGHVDSQTGPAVFYRLDELAAGDLIEVHGADGDVVTFTVRTTEQHPKDAFPTEAVYAGTAGPELRLITCGGDFDAGERSYRDNIVVFAERVTA